VSARDVVITGIGCLGPHGLGLPALAAALQRGEPLQRAIDRSGNWHRANSATQVASCGPLVLDRWVAPQTARRMSDLSLFAVATARMAIEDARLEPAALRSPRACVSLATAFGPGAFTEQLARQILEKGGRAASPFLFTDCVANAAAGQVAIDLGITGPNTTICEREAGPLLALAHGAAEIANGRADVCLAGAVDEMKGLSHALLDRFRALSRPGRHGEMPRPFDRRRNGILAGEGATILVLEAEPVARARAANVLARVGPTVRAFDPTAGRASFGRGDDALAATLRARLGSRLAEVDAVVSSAAGSRHGDALEAAILRRVFPTLPRVLVPKAVHGEYGGGTLAAAVLALQSADFALPPHCDTPDPSLGITLRGGRTTAHRVLCSALAAGGAAAWTILEAP